MLQDLDKSINRDQYLILEARNMSIVQTIQQRNCTVQPETLYRMRPGKKTTLICNQGSTIINYTPGRGKIVPRNVTLLVGEKLCRIM